MGKLVRFQRADLCSFGSGGHYNLQVMWKQMDREIPEGNIDLYILCKAYKWHPYAVKTLPITSPLTRIRVLDTCRTRTCLLCNRISLTTQISIYLLEVPPPSSDDLWYKCHFQWHVYRASTQCNYLTLVYSAASHLRWGMKNGKRNNSSQTGPNFLSGQMSIQRNYKVGLLHFHRLRSGNMVIHKRGNKAGFLFVPTHQIHIGHTLGGNFGYHHQPHRV